jgi:hypothetical protein
MRSSRRLPVLLHKQKLTPLCPRRRVSYFVVGMIGRRARGVADWWPKAPVGMRDLQAGASPSGGGVPSRHLVSHVKTANFFLGGTGFRQALNWKVAFIPSALPSRRPRRRRRVWSRLFWRRQYITALV